MQWLLCRLESLYFLVVIMALLTGDSTALEPAACWIAFFEWVDYLFTINVKTATSWFKWFSFSADSNNETSSWIFCFLSSDLFNHEFAFLKSNLTFKVLLLLYSCSGHFFPAVFFSFVLFVSCFDLLVSSLVGFIYLH